MRPEDVVDGLWLHLGLTEFEDTAWQEEGLCAQADPDAWFPQKGGSVLAAKRICQRCPVQAECLEYALTHDERFGVWGGLSERERRALKRKRRATS